ncbi:MAG: hypothetical protein J2O48_02755 [Solirubrobacterales bacterium]|nr:hypothetical protein [Solirubrobacterales bacterium]
MSEVQLLAWLMGIHLIGFIAVGALLIPTLRDDQNPPEDSDSGTDDGWGNLPNSEKPDPRGWPGGGIPLPDAEQSRIRFRGPGRLADKVPSHQRRPVRDPERAPVPRRTPSRH